MTGRAASREGAVAASCETQAPARHRGVDDSWAGHLGLGKLYRRTGKEDQARGHLTTATTMYREMDMRFWLEQVEAEIEA